MSDDGVKRVPLRLERELYRQIAQHALDRDISITAVIRECIAAKFTIAGTAANEEVIENGDEKESGPKTRKRTKRAS